VSRAGTALAGLVACVLALAGAGSARAATDAEEAERLMAAGVAHRQASKDSEALEDFTRAFQLSHDPKARAQMAIAEQALGLWVLAETHLNEALASDSPWVAKHRIDLTSALSDIRSHLGTLEVLGGTDGAEVYVNGQQVARLPLALPLRVPAGTVALEIRATGFLPVTRNVNVPPDGLARETITLARDEAWKAPTPPPPEPAATTPAVTVQAGEPAPAPHGAWRRPAAWAAAGGAALALGVGIIFTTRVYSYADKFNGDTSCNAAVSGLGGATCSSYHDSSTSAEAPAIIGYSLAAVLAGASAYLFMSERSHPTNVASRSWCCTPRMTDVGLVCGATF
jgi:hypothetical protein